MGASCQSFQSCKSQYSESYQGTVETKMKSLNEMSKSTKFSSLKQSLSQAPATMSFSYFLLNEIPVSEIDERVDQITIHSNLKKQKKYQFQEEEDREQQIKITSSQKIDPSSPQIIKPSLNKTIEYLSPLSLRQKQFDQDVDLSLYIQMLNNQQDLDSRSVKSILKQKSVNSSSSSCDRRVKFAQGTKFNTVRAQSHHSKKKHRKHQ